MNSPHALDAKREDAKPAKVRGWDRRLSPDARRQAIMDAAKALFLSKGYAATSLEEIVATSGGSLATLYQLFGNKQGLWEALVGEVTAMITAPLQDAMSHHGDPCAALKEYGLRLDALERSRECSGAFRMMLAEGGKYPELTQALFAKGPDTSRGILVAYLETEVAAGRLKIDDTTVATEHFRSLVCADTALRNACGVLQQASREAIERRIDGVVDLFLKVYGA